MRSKDGAVVRVFTSHQCAVYGMSLMFALALLRGFSPGCPVFHKNQHSKFQLDQDRGPA